MCIMYKCFVMNQSGMFLFIDPKVFLVRNQGTVKLHFPNSGFFMFKRPLLCIEFPMKLFIVFIFSINHVSI